MSGKIWKGYFVDCGQCNESVRLPADTKKDAEHAAKREGWKCTKSQGWICGLCQVKKEQEQICDRCKGPGLPLHNCPYQEEINDDRNPHCTCCDNCTTECAYDV